MTSELIYDVLLKESLNELLSNGIIYDEVILGVITPHPISSSHSVLWTMWELVRFIVCDATH